MSVSYVLNTLSQMTVTIHQYHQNPVDIVQVSCYIYLIYIQDFKDDEITLAVIHRKLSYFRQIFKIS